MVQTDLWFTHVGHGMKTRLGRRCFARKSAAMWFAPVPDTVCTIAICSLISAAIFVPKMRDWARLVKVGEPAMPRYSWFGFCARRALAWIGASQYEPFQAG